MTARTLHLVRHGRPRVELERPAAVWDLDPAAGVGLRRLRGSGVLPETDSWRARWFTSPEPKAVATARALTSTSIGFVDGLREMARPAGRLGSADFAAAVCSALTEPEVAARPGWETGASTRERVVSAVERVLGSCEEPEVVLVGHGTAWTLLVAELTSEKVDLASWQGLSMPDHCALELAWPATDGSRARARRVSGWGDWLAAGGDGDGGDGD